MKTLTMLLMLTASVIAAETYPNLTTRRGREYTDVTVTTVEPDGLRIKHESGTAKIPFSELPLEIQRKHNYDPVAAEQYSKEREAHYSAQEAALDEEISKSKKLKPRVAPKEPSSSSGSQTAKDNTKGGVPTQVKLNAATSSMGRSGGTSWSTSWGSYDKSVFRARAVSVSVSAATGGDCVIELHWIGSEPGRSSNQRVVKVERKPVTLVASRTLNHEFGLLFVENDTKYAALGERYREGYKYSGWVARVVSKDGRTLAIQAARPPMIRFVQ